MNLYDKLKLQKTSKRGSLAVKKKKLDEKLK